MCGGVPRHTHCSSVGVSPLPHSWHCLRLFGIACIIAIPRPGLAQESTQDAAASATATNAATPETGTQDGAPAASQPASPRVSYAPPKRNLFIPLGDIVAFDFLLNRFDKHFIDHDTYDVSFTTVGNHLTHGWVIDNDPYSINQFLHPYQGAMYHGFARSAGFNYWQSLGYTFAGSLLWEIAGETTTPSKNDQVASGIGGSFLGEPLFRIASLILEKSEGTPGFWRELLAGAISPPTGINRLVYADRFKPVFPGGRPATFTRLQVGANSTASALKDLGQTLVRNEAVADFDLEYGLPGNPDYGYRRPFDYFTFQFTASSANRFENIFSRGLLAGRHYGGSADSYRGVWGLFGSYDYVSPQLFRVSSTAVSLGNTSQRRISGTSALQSTMLLGVGYGAGGTINGAGERDYHYGVTPQLLVAVRLIATDRAAFDLTLRDYYVSGVGSPEDRGGENIARAETLITLRLLKHHAASVRYLWSRRSASYPDLGNRIQSRGTVGLFYTYLGGTRFGVIGWPGENRTP